METELLRLQRQVQDLQAALTAITQTKHTRMRRFATVATLLGAVVVISFAITMASGASSNFQGQKMGPLNVTAPFEVWDNKGAKLFAVVADPSTGGGRVYVFGKGEQSAVEIFANSSGDGAMDINKSGKARVELGISGAGDAGLIRLFSNTSKAQTVLHGDVGIRQTNAQGNPVFQAGPDDNSNGYAMVANRAGNFISKISTSSDGSSGRVEVSAGGEVKVLMGILANDKGDVCAAGEGHKQVCLSGLALKTLTPY